MLDGLAGPQICILYDKMGMNIVLYSNCLFLKFNVALRSGLKTWS